MKLKNILIGGFVIVALLIGIVSFISISSSEEAMTNTIGESSVELTGKILSEIDKDISNRIYEWESLLQSAYVQEALKASNAEFAQIPDVEAEIDARDAAWRETENAADNVLLTELMNNAVAKEFTKKLDFYTNEYGYPVYGEIFITNKYGANAAQTGKTSDYRQNDEDWWKNAAENGIFIEEVEYDDSAEAYVTALCIRINDENGNLIGVAKIALDIAEYINTIKDTKAQNQYTSANFELVDTANKVIYSTQSEEVLFDSELKPKLNINTGWEIIENNLVASSESEGYRDYNGLGWVLIASFDKSEILAPVNKLKSNLIIISIITIIIAVLLGLLLSAIISKPIIKMTDAGRQIADGNLKAKIPQVKGVDEIQALGETLTMLVGAINFLKKDKKKKK